MLMYLYCTSKGKAAVSDLWSQDRTPTLKIRKGFLERIEVVFYRTVVKLTCFDGSQMALKFSYIAWCFSKSEVILASSVYLKCTV